MALPLPAAQGLQATDVGEKTKPAVLHAAAEGKGVVRSGKEP
jgi:hypothetical protein